jgi:phosphate:Na+ symporter
MGIFNIGMLLGGLGLFLYGMTLTESSVRQLAGRTFKLFLRKHTQSRFKAIASGSLVTVILQSSSVVTLIVLAFVGAGVVTTENAFAVVIGSNLGTTFGSWLFATLGFKLEIAAFAFPLLAAGGLGYALFSSRKKLAAFGLFLLGFGMLFLGLDFMKDSVEKLATEFDISEYSHLPVVVFLLAGVLLTALIQSSTAMMAITLSTLNSGAISLEAALAVVAGSELGTTVKIMLGSLGGPMAKKQVAFGDMLFNAGTMLLAFALIFPFTWLMSRFGIGDPLIALVIFQTSINLAGIILVLPFFGKFTGFLKKRFTDSNGSLTEFVSKVNPAVPEAAGEALDKETRKFIERVVRLNRLAFGINGAKDEKPQGDYAREYENLKQLDGEILAFYSALREQEQTHEEREHTERLANAVRNAMYSAKGVKDIGHNLEELSSSADDTEHRQYEEFKKLQDDFWEKVIECSHAEAKQDPEKLSDIRNEIRETYEDLLRKIPGDAQKNGVNELSLSTLLNVNRELYSSNKALLNALKDLLLME